MNKRYQWYLIASLALVAILVLAGCAGAAPEAAAPEAGEAAAVEEAPAAEAGEKVLIYGLSQEPETTESAYSHSDGCPRGRRVCGGGPVGHRPGR